jgi:predicted NBD/HSP70 family sugar kinase
LPEYVADLITESELEAGFSARWLGITAPGRLIPTFPGRFSHLPPRLQPAEEINWLRSPFARDTHRTALLNCAQAALYAEVWNGAAKNRDGNMILLRVGHWLQAALFCHGSLLQGSNNLAGALDHLYIPVDQENAGAEGSNHSHAEQAVSPPVALDCQSALSENSLAGADHDYRTYRALWEAAGNGEEEARRVWHRQVHRLASLLAGLSAFEDPDILLVDGPITGARDLLLKPLHEKLRALLEQRERPCPTLVTTATGAYGASVGAARFAMLHARPPHGGRPGKPAKQSAPVEH